MTTTIQTNGDLKVAIDQAEKTALSNLKKEIGHDFNLIYTLYDYFDKLKNNTQYEWINPIEVNIHTGAPILATFGPQRKQTVYDEPNLPTRSMGYHNNAEWVKEIEHYWIWTDKSQTVLETLLISEEAIFEKGI